jgi:hypothetical protein
MHGQKSIKFDCYLMKTLLKVKIMLSVRDDLMSMEHWWNNTDTEKPKYEEPENLSRFRFIYHKTHTKLAGNEQNWRGDLLLD